MVCNVMLKRLLFLFVFLGLASSASAQPTTGYQVKVLNQSTNAIVENLPITPAQVTCGQTPKVPPQSGTVVNPRKLIFDDPAAPTTADCIYTDPGPGGIFSSLPFGSTVYVATVAATNSAGTGPDSAPTGPFTHPGAPPAVLTGVRVGS